MSRRWARGEVATCHCGPEPLRGEVVSGTAVPTSHPVVLCEGQEPHQCSTAQLVDRRGRPRLDVVPVRLSREAAEIADREAAKWPMPVQQWLEWVVKKEAGIK